MIFEFDVKIDAPTKDEARERLIASIQIMKAGVSAVGHKDYVEMAKKIEKSPSKIKLAKNLL